MLKIVLTTVFLVWLQGCATASGPRVAVVRVEDGDTLGAIADHYNVSVASIKKHNNLFTDLLEVGQVLEVPFGYADPSTSAGAQGLLFSSSGQLIWPVRGPVISPFGRRHGRPHEGIDIKAGSNTAIVAAHAGRVIHSGWSRGYGLTVILETKNHRTLYAHCRRVATRKGAWVERGQVIGYVGKTGNASGYHLHFEYRDLANRPYDPMDVLAQPALVSRR